MVEHDLAKVKMGVRFSLPAQFKNRNIGGFLLFVQLEHISVDKPVDTVYKGQTDF